MKMMRYLFAAFAIAICFCAAAYSQTSKKPKAPKYDAKLAKKLGGDDNGMKNYVFVILKTGPKDAEITGEERKKTFEGHMANINRLADEGKLAVAGPFGKNDMRYRGLFIFNVTTVEEAKALVETDPVIKSGMMIAEMTPWYGSAALMATNDLHKKIAKKDP